MKFKQQGDLNFTPFKGEATGEKIIHKGSHILALGEHTGHRHVIAVADPSDMQIWKELDGGFVITLKTEAEVTHNQHGVIKLAPGTYKMGHEREVDHFQSVVRQVAD